MSVIDHDCFPSEDLLHMARQTVKSLKPYLENIVKMKPMLRQYYPTIEDFRKHRRTWERDVFIPSIENAAERTRCLEAWRRKGEKKRHPTILEADQKVLAPLTKLFDDIVHQIYMKTGNKRARDRGDDWQLYDTPPEVTKFGIQLMQRFFPEAKTVAEVCAGNGEMVTVLQDRTRLQG